MKTNKSIIMAAMFIWFTMSMIGCSIYGRLAASTSAGERMDVESLVAKSGDFQIFYSGYGEKNPSGILFDPKTDDQTITVSDRWTRIEDPDKIRQIVEWIRLANYPGYYPVLSKIIGPDGKKYGYLFTGWSHVVIKGVSIDRIYVYDLPDPPQYLGNGEDF
ncbi:MAG: hypothetical protein AB1659_13530, partial [Thermodesulfobacteriota bacterium]